MGYRAAPLLTLALAFVAGGAFFSLPSVNLLTIENLDRSNGQLLQSRAPLRLEMRYVHSMYDRPVEETFRIETDRIVLEAVKTDHSGIVEYYGAEEADDLSRLNRDLGSSFDILIGHKGGQDLGIAGSVLSLRELGQPGDRVRVGVKRVALWRWMLSGMWQGWPRNGRPDRHKEGR